MFNTSGLTCRRFWRLLWCVRLPQREQTHDKWNRVLNISRRLYKNEKICQTDKNHARRRWWAQRPSRRGGEESCEETDVSDESTGYSSSVSWPAATGTVSCLQTLERTESLVGSQTLLHCQMVVRAWGSCSSNPFIMSLVVAVLFSLPRSEITHKECEGFPQHIALAPSPSIFVSLFSANGKTTPGLVFV